MKLGKDFILIKQVPDEELKGGGVTLVLPTYTERALMIAKILSVNNTYANLTADDVVVVDDNKIVYLLENDMCIVEASGVLCKYDIDAYECRAFDGLGRDKLVLKQSIPDEAILMRNALIQSGLVIIGGIQSKTTELVFDTPVVMTASPESTTHLFTKVGDYYLASEENIIVEYSTPTSVSTGK